MKRSLNARTKELRSRLSIAVKTMKSCLVSMAHIRQIKRGFLEFAAKNLDLSIVNWIGLHSPGKSGVWQWSDGSAFDFNNWGDGFPVNPGDGNQKCVYAYTDVASTNPQIWYHHWYNNGNCEDVWQSAICQKKSAYLTF